MFRIIRPFLPAILLLGLSSAIASSHIPVIQRSPYQTSSLITPALGKPEKAIGSLNISSRCPFPTYYRLWNTYDRGEPWQPIPEGGFVSPFTEFYTNLDVDLPMNFSFGLSSDGSKLSAVHGAQLRMMWLKESKTITFNILQDEDYQWNPIVIGGYMAWPTPEDQSIRANCTRKHCPTDEMPCKAAYAFDDAGRLENPTMGKIGYKSSVCPDVNWLNFQLCTDIHV